MKNVVIIGAGPAGLTAAYTLLKESSEYHPIIVEASGLIGGISRTERYNGNRIDIGGHRFFSKNEEIMKLWSVSGRKKKRSCKRNARCRKRCSPSRRNTEKMPS